MMEDKFREVFQPNADESIETVMVKALLQYDETTKISIKIAWDDAQRKFECCGVESPEDWLYNANLHGQYPRSCCRVNRERD
ncbi:unnamed protein product, partial [Darwinula stevensoni]